MKAIFGFFIILWLIAGVACGQGLDRKVSLSHSNISLGKLLVELQDRYALRFSYSPDLIDLDQKVSIDVKEAELNDVLKTVFRDAGVDFVLAGDQIVLRPKYTAGRSILEGRVVDQRTGASLPLASVRLEGTPLGTLTNNDGEFLLHIPEKYSERRVVLSFIGYKPRAFSLDQKITPRIFGLEEDETTLKAVTVTAKNGLSILQEAIARIGENYDTGNVIYTYFMRDLALREDTPVGASEGVYQAYRGSLKTSSLKQIKAVKGRRVKDFAFLQSILQAFPRWTGFEVGIDRQGIFLADLNARHSNDEFPGAAFLKRHEFELLGTSLLEGKEVYVVAFDQKDAYRSKSLYKGKFYIDTESLAFLRIESELSPKGVRHAKFFGTSRAMALLFGYSRCAVLGLKTIINYKTWKGKWYPGNLEVFWNARLATHRDDLFVDLNLNGDIVVTDIQTGDVKPFDASELLEDRNWEYMYKIASWDGYNAVPADVEMENAFQTIARENKEHGIDMKFWRRYQPYKRHPEWLVRDSILCHRGVLAGSDVPRPDSIMDMNEGHEYKLLRARYPALNTSLSSKHFVIQFLSPDSVHAREILSTLEQSHDRILRDFGIKNLSGPIHAEIYPDIAHYHFAIGKPDAPDSDAGMAVDDNRFKMVSPGNPGSYHTRESLMKAAVHEFAHCVHYQFLNRLGEQDQLKIANGQEAPWLFEAMASFEAGQFYDPRRFEYLRKGQFPTLAELNDVEQNGKVYDLGFVLMAFIESIWGREKVLGLLRLNGDIPNALGLSEAEFERKFYIYLRHTYLDYQK